MLKRYLKILGASKQDCVILVLTIFAHLIPLATQSSDDLLGERDTFLHPLPSYPYSPHLCSGIT